MDKNIDIQALQQKIAQLEAENYELKKNTKSNIAYFGFDFLFEAVKQPVFIIKCNNQGASVVTIEKANKSALELIKYTNDELSKLSPYDIGIFSGPADAMKYCNNLSADEKVSYLAKINTKDENQISSEISLYKFIAGQNVYFIVFQRNIGNQIKVVEALRQSEFRFLQMAENVVEGIIIVENNKRVFLNSSICRITGYSKDELRDMDELHLCKEHEVERIKDFLSKITGSISGVHAIEFWINMKNGQEKYIRNNYTFSQTTDGKKTIYIITSDITSQKRIEQALRKSQTEFRMLAENSPDFITRYNRELKYVYANHTVEKITGIPISQIIGSNNMELNLESDTVSFLEDMHLEVLRTGRSLKFEFRLNVSDKHLIFQAHLVPELSNKGIVESVLNVSRDITQIKEVERNLNDEKQKVIEDNTLISQKLVEFCNAIKTDFSNVTNLNSSIYPIERIADWTKKRFISNEFKPQQLIVNKLIKTFFEENAELIQSKNLEATIFLPVHEIFIWSDTNLLNSVLTYLLENALEATNNGKIEIGFDIYDENNIVFFVKDTGVGIQSEFLETVFDPFVSINKPNHPGLGLSIAKKYVEMMQGIIWCLSSEGTGSTFCFLHPAQIEKALLQSKQNENNVESSWNDKIILIVEDTDNNFILLEGILRKYKPVVIRAITGEDAVKIASEKTNIDLILMDIQLPGMNGYDATMQIRQFNKTVPIIAQTAYAMYDDVVKALDAGCNDFLAKPIKTKKFLSVIEKYLDKKSDNTA